MSESDLWSKDGEEIRLIVLITARNPIYGFNKGTKSYENKLSNWKVIVRHNTNTFYPSLLSLIWNTTNVFVLKLNMSTKQKIFLKFWHQSLLDYWGAVVIILIQWRPLSGGLGLGLYWVNNGLSLIESQIQNAKNVLYKNIGLNPDHW